MKYLSPLRGIAVIAICALVLTAVIPTRAQADTSFSGRAFAAYVHVNGLVGPVYISDTGDLAAEGGYLHCGLLDVSVLGVLRANVLSASTSGSTGNAHSRASLADVVLTVPGAPTITASFLQARTHAHCKGTSGSSHIAQLTVGGKAITVGTAPNQVIALPLGVKLILNEQTHTQTGAYREVRTNALRLIVPGVAEVILSGAKSDIRCSKPEGDGPCHDFVTGGGWIVTSAGARANFGFNAGFKAKSLSPDGHINYIDHGSSMKVKGLSVDKYVETCPTSRRFEGACEIDGAPGRYIVDVDDKGEPGRSDTFKITLSNGYSAFGTLEGGNIQLHKPCRK